MNDETLIGKLHARLWAISQELLNKNHAMYVIENNHPQPTPTVAANYAELYGEAKAIQSEFDFLSALLLPEAEAVANE